jgi:hypothetical protein
VFLVAEAMVEAGVPVGRGRPRRRSCIDPGGSAVFSSTAPRDREGRASTAGVNDATKRLEIDASKLPLPYREAVEAATRRSEQIGRPHR